MELRDLETNYGSVRQNLREEMIVPELAKAYFTALDREIGPFDRPFQFRPFPFDAGGALNFLTVGLKRERFVTYVSWDLFGHEQQQRGNLGRFEFLVTCDEEDWCVDVITKVGRQSLLKVFEPNETFDLASWVKPESCIQGLVFEEAFNFKLSNGRHEEQCGVLRCIGVTRQELNFAHENGTPALMKALKRAGIYPRTIVKRDTVELS